MVLNIKVNTIKIKNKEMVSLIGLMEAITKVNSKIISLMDLVNSIGMMVEFTKVNTSTKR